MKGIKEMKLYQKVAPVLLVLLVISGCNALPTQPTQPTPTSSQQTNSGSSVQENGSIKTKVKTDTGRYNGQIDSNSIEIKLSGVPDEIEPQAFRLSEPIKAKFETYKLNTGDTLKFNYSVNEHGQNIILELSILNRISKTSQTTSDNK